MGDETPDPVVIQCPGCESRFRLTPKKGRLPTGDIPCPKCFEEIPVKDGKVVSQDDDEPANEATDDDNAAPGFGVMNPQGASESDGEQQSDGGALSNDEKDAIAELEKMAADLPSSSSSNNSTMAGLPGVGRDENPFEQAKKHDKTAAVDEEMLRQAAASAGDDSSKSQFDRSEVPDSSPRLVDESHAGQLASEDSTAATAPADVPENTSTAPGLRETGEQKSVPNQLRDTAENERVRDELVDKTRKSNDSDNGDTDSDKSSGLLGRIKKKRIRKQRKDAEPGDFQKQKTPGSSGFANAEKTTRAEPLEQLRKKSRDGDGDDDSSLSNLFKKVRENKAQDAEKPAKETADSATGNNAAPATKKVDSAGLTDKDSTSDASTGAAPSSEQGHSGLFDDVESPEDADDADAAEIGEVSDKKGSRTTQSALARLKKNRSGNDSSALDIGAAGEKRGSGYIRLPTEEIQDVLGHGDFRLKIEGVVYEPVDKQGLIKLIKGGVLLGAEEIAEAGGDWMPISEHPVFGELRRKMAAEAHDVLSRIGSQARTPEDDVEDAELPKPASDSGASKPPEKPSLPRSADNAPPLPQSADDDGPQPPRSAEDVPSLPQSADDGGSPSPPRSADDTDSSTSPDPEPTDDEAEATDDEAESLDLDNVEIDSELFPDASSEPDGAAAENPGEPTDEEKPSEAPQQPTARGVEVDMGEPEHQSVPPQPNVDEPTTSAPPPDEPETALPSGDAGESAQDEWDATFGTTEQPFEDGGDNGTTRAIISGVVIGVVCLALVFGGLFLTEAGHELLEDTLGFSPGDSQVADEETVDEQQADASEEIRQTVAAATDNIHSAFPEDPDAIDSDAWSDTLLDAGEMKRALNVMRTQFEEGRRDRGFLLEFAATAHQTQDYALARRAAFAGITDFSEDDEFFDAHRRAVEDDDSLFAYEYTQLAEPDGYTADGLYDVADHRGVVLEADDGDVLFKPQRDGTGHQWRAEVAAWRFCELVACHFEVPETQPAVVTRDFIEELDGDTTGLESLIAEANWESIEFDELGETEAVRGSLKRLTVDQTAPFPIEELDLWRGWLTPGSSTAFADEPIESTLTELQQLDDGRFYDQLVATAGDLATGEVARSLSSLLMFDYLTNNWERFVMNSDAYGINNVVSPEGMVSRHNGAAFQPRASRRVRGRFEWTSRFSDSTVATVEALDRETTYEVLFPNQTTGEQRRLDVMWEQRDDMLDRVDQLVATHGDDDVLLFD